MQVQPNSTIMLFSGVPLDNTYEHTLWFDSAGAQNFGTPVRVFNANTYQRVNAGVFQARCLADEIYNCNYMAFQNTSFGGKWFYAFITSIEYVNNGTTNVYYEIDVMQTYLHDVTLKACTVEREHTVQDLMFQHLQPEPVQVHDYIFEDYTDAHDLYHGAMGIIVGTAEVANDDEMRACSGDLIDGVFNGLTLHYFSATPGGIAQLRQLVSNYTIAGKADGVICMYMVPAVTMPGVGDGSIIAYSSSAFSLNITLPRLSDDWTLDGYKPKNRKMYTYPFNFVHVDNSSGDSLQLKYELFDAGLPTMKTYCSISTPVQISLYPMNYKRVSGNLNTECLKITDYPLCSWTYDAFADWCARSAVPMAVNAIPNVIGSLTNPAGLVTGAVSAVSSGLQAYFAPDVIKGSVGGGNVDFASGQKAFHTGRCCASYDDAIVIDEFFTRYGYACNRTKVPNRNVRPHWTYTKTIGCVAVGNCPADDVRKICNIYDKGITFWKNIGEVGNYQLDNTV